jgi:soluble P-type ATPase
MEKIMINLSIPGFGDLSLKYAVFDYNGTLACDGELLPGVNDALLKLKNQVDIHVLTADTFGRVRKNLESFPLDLHILQTVKEDKQKAAYIKSLGANKVVAFGNGNNDYLMLKGAALSIVVLESEGCTARTLSASNIVVKDILNGIDLLLNPMRLMATLRF